MIKEKLKEKHNLRKQCYRSSIIRTKLNKTIRNIKKLLIEKKCRDRNASALVPLKHLNIL